MRGVAAVATAAPLTAALPPASASASSLSSSMPSSPSLPPSSPPPAPCRRNHRRSHLSRVLHSVTPHAEAEASRRAAVGAAEQSQPLGETEPARDPLLRGQRQLGLRRPSPRGGDGGGDGSVNRLRRALAVHAAVVGAHDGSGDSGGGGNSPHTCVALIHVRHGRGGGTTAAVAYGAVMATGEGRRRGPPRRPTHERGPALPPHARSRVSPPSFLPQTRRVHPPPPPPLESR